MTLSKTDKEMLREFWENPDKKELRVWWKPQVPCKSFEVPVRNLREAQLLSDALAKYDLFQLEENIKPDFSNAGGVVVKEGEEWEDYHYEPEGMSFDEMIEYLQDKELIPDIWQDKEAVTEA